MSTFSPRGASVERVTRMDSPFVVRLDEQEPGSSTARFFGRSDPTAALTPSAEARKGVKMLDPFGASEAAQALYPSHPSPARRRPFLGSKMEGRAVPTRVGTLKGAGWGRESHRRDAELGRRLVRGRRGGQSFRPLSIPGEGVDPSIQAIKDPLFWGRRWAWVQVEPGFATGGGPDIAGLELIDQRDAVSAACAT
jgi:hypothetical protein